MRNLYVVNEWLVIVFSCVYCLLPCDDMYVSLGESVRRGVFVSDWFPFV